MQTMLGRACSARRCGPYTAPLQPQVPAGVWLQLDMVGVTRLPRPPRQRGLFVPCTDLTAQFGLLMGEGDGIVRLFEFVIDSIPSQQTLSR